jgi:hypothetical protein
MRHIGHGVLGIPPDVLSVFEPLRFRKFRVWAGFTVVGVAINNKQFRLWQLFFVYICHNN